MYRIFKNRINAGGYQLTDIQQRIKCLYARGDLSQEQMDELIALSQQNAEADSERPALLRMITRLSARVEALEKLVLQQKDTEVEAPQYAAWIPWDGISDNYQQGTVVTHNGALWTSVFTGQNVWEPGTPGSEALWVEYTEEVTENV